MIGWMIWLGTLKGRLATAAMMVAVLVGLRAWDVSHQRGVGAREERARVERATDHAIDLGRTAARASSAAPAIVERAPEPAPAASVAPRRVQPVRPRPGTRDPSTRDD